LCCGTRLASARLMNIFIDRRQAVIVLARLVLARVGVD
jgi:hypothetical protein